MSHKKFGPDRYSRFEVYWIQTDRQAKFIYRRNNNVKFDSNLILTYISHMLDWYKCLLPKDAPWGGGQVVDRLITNICAKIMFFVEEDQVLACKRDTCTESVRALFRKLHNEKPSRYNYVGRRRSGCAILKQGFSVLFRNLDKFLVGKIKYINFTFLFLWREIHKKLVPA